MCVACVEIVCVLVLRLYYCEDNGSFHLLTVLYVGFKVYHIVVSYLRLVFVLSLYYDVILENHLYNNLYSFPSVVLLSLHNYVL